MNFRTTFRSKLFLLTIVPLAVAQVVTLIAVMQTVQDDVYRRVHESLVVGGTVIDEYRAARSEQLRASARVLAADFGLKQAAATRDKTTLESILQNHSQRVSADIAIFLDREGKHIASTEEISRRNSTDLPRLIDPVTESASVQSTLTVKDVTYHTVAETLRAPVPIGWIVLGYRIDQSVVIVDAVLAVTALDACVISVRSVG